MHPTVNIALRAARIASEQIARATERLEIIQSEQENVADFVEHVCTNAERVLAGQIHKTNPTHRVVGMHSGEIPCEDGAANPETEWFVNPIDGLTNFAKGLPWYALTLVFREKGKVEHVVLINPTTGEEFTASRGRGAQLNGRRIRVNPTKEFNGSLVALSKSMGDDSLDQYISVYSKLTDFGCEVQNAGSLALSLAYVAAGRLEACCLLEVEEESTVPGQLLIQEAGGLMGDLSGKAKVASKGNLIAANPKLFKQLLQGLK